MSWELSQKGFEMLKTLEGYRNKPYRLKNEKYYTCCMGHSGPDVQKNKVYSDKECNALFAYDKIQFENAASRFPNIRTQGQFDALFSLCYNCGSGIAKSGRDIFNLMSADVHDTDPDEFCRRWLAYRNCNGALISRRQKELDMFYSDSDGDKQ